MRLVAFFAMASRRAASGNNDRLSTPWREVISLAGVTRSFSKHRRAELAVPRSTRGTRWKIEKARGRYAKQRRDRNRRAMDTLTLRPGRTLPQQRRICGTPSVLAFHFTPRLPEISPILWLIQRTFTSRSPCRSASATPQDGGEVAISAKNGVPRPGASTGVVEIIIADTGAHGGRCASASVRLQFHDEAGWARFESRSRPGPAICPRERRRY
jgi:hypothetical protein